MNAEGVPRFQMLQHRSKTAKSQIVYYAFDLLSLEGRDLKNLPLKERKAALAKIAKGSNVLLSDPLPGSPDRIVEAARAMKLEGVIAKRVDSKYEPGLRTGAWRKLRLNVSQEFVVGGYSPGSPFDSILVGYYEGRKLMFCARVRAGFTTETRRELWERIKDTHISSCSFDNLPTGKSGGWNEGVAADEMKNMKWVKPTLVVQVAFVGLVAAGDEAVFVPLLFDDPELFFEVLSLVSPLFQSDWRDRADRHQRAPPARGGPSLSSTTLAGRRCCGLRSRRCGRNRAPTKGAQGRRRSAGRLFARRERARLADEREGGSSKRSGASCRSTRVRMSAGAFRAWRTTPDERGIKNDSRVSSTSNRCAVRSVPRSPASRVTANRRRR